MAFTEKYVTDAGAGSATGADLANAWSWATMLTTLAAGERANYNGNITGGTAAQSFTNAGTAALPMALRAVDGSGVAITTTRAAGAARDMTGVGVITYTSTGRLTFPSFMVVSDISVTGAVADSTVTSGSTNSIRRCKIENTHGSSSSALGLTLGTGAVGDDCDLLITSTNANAYAGRVGQSIMIRCRANAGSSGASGIDINDRGAVINCTIINFATGVNISGSVAAVVGCSFRNGSSNYFNQAGSPLMSVSNCVAWGSGGSSKWYNSTTSVRSHGQFANAVGNMGAADTNEGDWPVEGQVTLTADPFTSSTDLTLNSDASGGTLCKGVGLHPYLDIGAWQVQAGAGGGSTSYVIGG